MDIAAPPDWPESPRLGAVALLRTLSQTLPHTAGENTAAASFKPRPPLEWYFATDTFKFSLLYGHLDGERRKRRDP